MDPIAKRLSHAQVPFVVMAREERDGHPAIADKLSQFSREHTLSALASRLPFAMPPRFNEAVEHLAQSVWHGCAGGVGGEGPLQLVRLARRYYVRVAVRRVQTWWHARAEKAVLSCTQVFISTIDCAHTVHQLLYERGRALEVVIVDEAGCVPEWKMPILTTCSGAAISPELILLVGDQQQLPPFTLMRYDAAPVSALERMTNALPLGSVKMLRTQYRMPPEVCVCVRERESERERKEEGVCVWAIFVCNMLLECVYNQCDINQCAIPYT